MALFRREKSWTVRGADAPRVNGAVLRALEQAGIRIESRGVNGPIEGRSGSGLTSLVFWNERTAPYRVRVSVTEVAGGEVAVEAAFEEGSQAGMYGPKKTRTYSRLADRIFDSLQSALAEIAPIAQPGQGAADAGPDATEQIRRLAELRDAGALSEEEFEAKKKELLARI